MGIKGLETFIREDPNSKIAEIIDIRTEIANWRSKHGPSNRPEIIINLKDFTKVLANIGDETLIIGGQYDMYNEKFEKFFKVLHSECGVDLVFFCRPYLNDMTESDILRAYDEVKNNSDIKKHKKYNVNPTNFFPWHLDKRFLFNLMQICPKYGRVYTELNHCNAKIVDYACKNPDKLLAMIQHDTDFLLYDNIQYQYWDLVDLDITQFTTKVYRRDILYEEFGLATPQFHVLSAISRFGRKYYKWMKSLPTKHDRPAKLFKLVEYVKQEHNISHESEFNLDKIIYDISKYHKIGNEVREKIVYDLERYNIHIQDETLGCKHFSRELMTFCKENLYFMYGFLVEDFTSNQSLAYIDLRLPGSEQYIEAMVILHLKMYAILVKDVNANVRPKTRKIEFKRCQNGNADPIEESIVDYHPPMVLPTLEQLILDEGNDEFKASRWSLFQWLLGLENESDSIPTIYQLFYANGKFLRLVNFTLTFLLKHNLIANHEADTIFLTESAGQIENDVDLNWRDIEMEWIQTAHKYTIAFEMICHCLEICGLRSETDLIKFNAPKFHANMLQARMQSNRIEGTTDQLQNICLY